MPTFPPDEEKDVPCDTCKRPTPHTYIRLCQNCWEVEKRLESYLDAPGGRMRVRRMLTEIYKEDDGYGGGD